MNVAAVVGTVFILFAKARGIFVVFVVVGQAEVAHTALVEYSTTLLGALVVINPVADDLQA